MAREVDFARLIQKNLPEVHWQRIETGGTGLGIPDLNYCCDGVEGWIELKSVASGWQVGLRPEQVAWLARRERAGGRTFVAVRRIESIYLYRGTAAAELKVDGLRGLAPRLALLTIRERPWMAFKSLILNGKN